MNYFTKKSFDNAFEEIEILRKRIDDVVVNNYQNELKILALYRRFNLVYDEDKAKPLKDYWI